MDSDALDRLDSVTHGGTSDPDVLDFSANTNPRSPPGVVAAYDAALSSSRRYPSSDYPEFRNAAAEYVGCEGRQVLPTAGGMAGIRLVVSTVLEDGDDALLPAPSFGEYAKEVEIHGGTPTFVAHDAILDADPTDYALVVVCTPNNPTGEAYETGDLQAFARRCRKADTTLLVDEAFLDFTERPSLAGEPGVVVARSLTKMFGLPGLRAGFLVATGDQRDRLDTARVPWGLSTPAATVGAHCLQQTEFVEETRATVESERERMAARLATRFDVSPSDAPFLLLDVGDEDVDAIVESARSDGVAVRDARTFRTLDNHVRVAVKRPDANDQCLAALDV